jgi:hypothetical protein
MSRPDPLAFRADVPVTAAAQDELVRVNLNVPKATRIAWKTAALQQGVTLAELINEAMSKYSKSTYENEAPRPFFSTAVTLAIFWLSSVAVFTNWKAGLIRRFNLGQLNSPLKPSTFCIFYRRVKNVFHWNLTNIIWVSANDNGASRSPTGGSHQNSERVKAPLPFVETVDVFHIHIHKLKVQYVPPLKG